MKDDIRNIINFENITRVRSSIGTTNKLPEKNSIVKLVPLECLEQGVKVLIDGKLFIAFIDEKIPLKEELIAYVTETNPFALSLDFSSQLIKNEKAVVNKILQKLNLPNTSFLRKIIVQVIEEGNILIKSKILALSELLSHFEVNGLEFSFLINLVWFNSDKQKDFIEDLYFNLFDEKFEVVCEHLFNAVKDILFTNLPPYLIQKFRETLVYSEENKNTVALLNKIVTISELIKLLNESNVSRIQEEESEKRFVYYGTKYVLQKSLLKDYDYFPDFIMIEYNSSLLMINYSIKKIINKNDETSYKLEFKNKNLPFKLNGILKDKLLVGNTELDEAVFSSEEISSLSESFYNNWGIRSYLSTNIKKKKRMMLPNLDIKLNKLVS